MSIPWLTEGDIQQSFFCIVGVAFRLVRCLLALSSRRPRWLSSRDVYLVVTHTDSEVHRGGVNCRVPPRLDQPSLHFRGLTIPVSAHRTRMWTLPAVHLRAR